MPLPNPAHVQETLFWCYNNTNVILSNRLCKLYCNLHQIEIWTIITSKAREKYFYLLTSAGWSKAQEVQNKPYCQPLSQIRVQVLGACHWHWQPTNYLMPPVALHFSLCSPAKSIRNAGAWCARDPEVRPTPKNDIFLPRGAVCKVLASLQWHDVFATLWITYLNL